MGRRERRLAGVQYIAGLLLPGRRKYIRPLADWLGVDHQSLQQFLTDSPWKHEEIWTVIRSLFLASEIPADLCVVNERTWPKQGQQSVGVARQRSGGSKDVRCQVSLEILVSQNSLAAPVASRLHLPGDWCDSEPRRDLAGIPREIKQENKPALALELLRQISDDAIPKYPVVADCEFGDSRDFRNALWEMQWEFLLGIDPVRHVVQAQEFPEGRPGSPISLVRLIESTKSDEWLEYHSRPYEGTATRRLLGRRIAMDCSGGQDKMVWLVVDWPADAPRPLRCYLSSSKAWPAQTLEAVFSKLPASGSNYKQFFENELDLANYQGRSWRGFHHHLALASAAYFFIFMTELNQKHEESPSRTGNDPVVRNEISRLAKLI
jgi:SRSO17 transposase